MAEPEKTADTEAEGKGKAKAKGKPDAKAEAGAASSGGPSQMKLVIVGAVALFIAVLGAQVAAPVLNRMIEGHGQAAAPAAEGEETAAAEAAPIEIAAAEPEKKEPLEPAQYVGLDPPFVVSFDEEDGTRYVQIQIQAMTRNEKTIEEIKKHSPALRNSFLFLLGGYKLEELTTLAGKEKLRADLTAKANEVLAKNGSEGQIEELYFTNFVIQ